ncbi:hypothetical protein HY745_10335, partial [Candidatus Desantisbacteria bacterium]|nr:hypothetical protein [Candidatus Desantisbacteria bacterium]
MGNQDYKRPDIPKKAKPYALLSVFLFVVSSSLTFFALVFKSIPIFMFALPSWGLLTIIKVLYNKMVPLPLRKEINEKILSPLPVDENNQESVLIPVRKHSRKIYYGIVVPVIAIIFLLAVLFFANNHTNFTLWTNLIFL